MNNTNEVNIKNCLDTLSYKKYNEKEHLKTGEDNPILNPISLLKFFKFDKRTKKFKFRDLEFWFELKGEIPKKYLFGSVYSSQ